MLFSFKITTNTLARNTSVIVQDGDVEYSFIARKGQNEHFYTNIPVKNVPRVKFAPSHTLEQLSAGGHSFLTERQKKANRGVINDRHVRYQVSVKGIPKRAIVTFPTDKGSGGWEIPYSLLAADSIDVDNAVYISFQDSYLTAGSYFLSDNYGNSPLKTVGEIITQTLDKYEISKSESYFLGSGKGANTATIVSSAFESNKLILLGYQLDLESWIEKSHLAYLLISLNNFGIRIPNAMNLLQEESWKKETHYFFESAPGPSDKSNILPFDAPNLFLHSTTAKTPKMLITEMNEIRRIIKD